MGAAGSESEEGEGEEGKGARLMARRCSHCGQNGHNARTCPGRSVMLFGVRITEGHIRKTVSTGNLEHYPGGAAGGGAPGDKPEQGNLARAYSSEDLGRQRKKGTPWTLEEHKKFLIGLKQHGKGDWRTISRNFVLTRTPTQVASHAQKHFDRQLNLHKRKRRTSLFDIVPDDEQPAEAPHNPISSQEPEATVVNPLPPAAPPVIASTLAAAPILASVPYKECVSKDSDSNSNSNNRGAFPKINPLPFYPVMVPAYINPYYQGPIPYWPGHEAAHMVEKTHEVLRPTAIHSKAPINVNQTVGMSELSLQEFSGRTGPPSLSQNLLGCSDGPSAFHAKTMR